MANSLYFQPLTPVSKIMSQTINTETYQNNNSSGGGCGKALLWLFFIALILSCLCCAGFIGMSYYIGSSLQKGFVEDPVVAEEKAVEAFGELNLPENVKPQSFLSVKLFGRDFGFGSLYSWELASNELPAAAEKPEESPEESAPEPEEAPDESAAPSKTPAPVEVSADVSVDAQESNNGTIIFYSLSDVLKGNEKDVVEGFSKGLTNPNNDKDITVKRSETIPITIKGEPCDFTFSWMENKDKNTFLMVSGSFTSVKETQCNVLIILPGEPSQETVIDVLENIQK